MRGINGTDNIITPHQKQIIIVTEHGDERSNEKKRQRNATPLYKIMELIEPQGDPPAKHKNENIVHDPIIEPIDGEGAKIEIINRIGIEKEARPIIETNLQNE